MKYFVCSLVLTRTITENQTEFIMYGENTNTMSIPIYMVLPYSAILSHMYLFPEFITDRSTLHRTVSSTAFSSILEIVTAHKSIESVPGAVIILVEDQMYVILCTCLLFHSHVAKLLSLS